MSVTIVLGAQFGDEGKGKIVDDLARDADYVIRFNGGGNAGHTVVIGEKKYALHLLPCGILREGTVNIVGPGVAFDLAIGAHELDIARANNAQVFLDQNAPVVLPLHRAIDAGREKAAGNQAIGTTKRGIGPTYSDFWLRRGLTLNDLRSETRITEALLGGGYWSEMMALRSHLGLHDPKTIKSLDLGMDPLSLGETIAWCRQYADRVCEHVCDTRQIVQNAYEADKLLLFEGAQGVMLDAFQGTRPFCTSSLCTAAGVSATFGIYDFDQVIGVAKAYVTRVGNGPFPTELHDETGETLRTHGHEYGTTTGRPRRCGWLDLHALNYACRMGGITDLVITKLDVLSGMDPKICFSYENETSPVLVPMSGWDADLRGMRERGDLPQEVKDYLDEIAQHLDLPISGVSVGPERSQIIWF